VVFLLQVHLAIRGRDERKLAGKTFAVEIARDLAGLIDGRQRESRQLDARGRFDVGDRRLDLAPARQDLLPRLLVEPRQLHLLFDVLVVALHGACDIGEDSHASESNPMLQGNLRRRQHPLHRLRHFRRKARRCRSRAAAARRRGPSTKRRPNQIINARGTVRAEPPAT